MSDDWELPVPRDDPEARKPPVGGSSGGGGCPMTPGHNFVEGETAEDDARAPERAPDSGGE